MNKTYFLPLVIFSVLIAGCTSNSNSSTNTTDPSVAGKDTTENTNVSNENIKPPAGEDPVVTLERMMCRGFCPVYTLEIYEDGTVVYEGEDHVDVAGQQTAKIEANEVAQLLADLEELGYWEFEDKYLEQNATDLPSVTTSATKNDATKTIEHYVGDYTSPSELIEAEELIDEVANSDQWVGSDS